jgi:hypothetical protein
MLAIEERHIRDAWEVSANEQQTAHFMEELQREAPEFCGALLAMREWYAEHYAKMHIGLREIERHQRFILEGSFTEVTVFLLSGLRAAHGKIPQISMSVINEPMTNHFSEGVVEERFARFHGVSESWIHEFMMTAYRSRIAGAETLMGDMEDTQKVCLCGVGLIFMLTDVFLKAAEAERSEDIALAMHRTAPDFAKFIEGLDAVDKLGNKA